MSILDLLIDLYNNEEMPKKIMVKGIIYLFDNDVNWYIDITGDSFLESNYKHINDEVEIIEEKKIPEKITINENGTIGFPNGQWTARNMDKAFAMKINSIIDYLKSKGE